MCALGKLQIIPYKFDKEVTKITIFQGESKEIMTNYIDNLCEILCKKGKNGETYEEYLEYKKTI